MQRVSIYNKGIAGGQKRANFSVSFNAYCLVVSQKFATLHTHTHNVRTYCSIRLFHFLLRAREAWCTHSLQRDSQRISLQAFSYSISAGGRERETKFSRIY